jgi:hypothetical protein
VEIFDPCQQAQLIRAQLAGILVREFGGEVRALLGIMYADIQAVPTTGVDVVAVATEVGVFPPEAINDLLVELGLARSIAVKPDSGHSATSSGATKSVRRLRTLRHLYLLCLRGSVATAPTSRD